MPRTSDSVPEKAPAIDGDVLQDEQPDGVDDSLILWFLSLTPLERLEWAEEMAGTVLALREAREL